MRHTNAQTTMNIYTQAMSDSLREAMEEFDQNPARWSAVRERSHPLGNGVQ
jgi:hypothetical protein